MNPTVVEVVTALALIEKIGHPKCDSRKYKNLPTVILIYSREIWKPIA